MRVCDSWLAPGGARHTPVEAQFAEYAQAELVCLVAQCTADSNNWESGLRHCENAMGVLPSATHLPISKWKVGMATP